MWPIFEMQRQVARSLIFLDFMGDLKKVVNVNFRNAVQIKYKTNDREDFPISLNEKGKQNTGRVKTVVCRLKISNSGYIIICHEQSLFLIRLRRQLASCILFTLLCLSQQLELLRIKDL